MSRARLGARTLAHGDSEGKSSEWQPEASLFDSFGTRREPADCSRRINSEDPTPKLDLSHPPTPTFLSHPLPSHPRPLIFRENENENEFNPLRYHGLHHPRHGRQPRPLEILPSREQPVLLERPSQRQGTTSVREGSVAKDKKIRGSVHDGPPSTHLTALADIWHTLALSRITQKQEISSSTTAA